MRLLVLGDMAGTGFGTVTFEAGRALIDQGVDVRFVSLNEQASMIDDLPEPFKGRTWAIGHPTGWLAFESNPALIQGLQDRLDAIFRFGGVEQGWGPDAVLMLGDAASVGEAGAVLRLPEGLPAFHYVPIEGIGIPPRWASTWRRFSPIAMSEFGADQLAPLIGFRPPVVYHGVNTERFWSVSRERPIVLRGKNDLIVLRTKGECKAYFGGNPGHTWLFRADRNMPRKAYWALLRAVAPLLAADPNLFMVYHCKTIDGGGNLEDEKSHYPAQIAAKMISTGMHDDPAVGGAPVELLNVLYNAADIYVSTSAEGFGLTIAEAMACGVPAVGLHYSSVPEVVGNTSGEPGRGEGGVTVGVGGLFRNIYAHWWAYPDIDAYTKAVEYLVTHKTRREGLGAAGAAHVRRSFSWEDAARQFTEIIGAGVRQEIAA